MVHGILYKMAILSDLGILMLAQLWAMRLIYKEGKIR